MRTIRHYILLLLCCLCSVSMAKAEQDEIQLYDFHDGTMTLKQGAYVITKEINYDMNRLKMVGPAIRIEPNSVVTIRIPSGIKVSLWGSDAKPASKAADGQPSYPAVELPASSTLILKGDGVLKVHGGAGAWATAGTNGKDAGLHEGCVGGDTGRGGYGGNGSYGNAPGIGTAGGRGGDGGNCPDKVLSGHSGKFATGPEYCGHAGGNGEASADCGTIYVLGNLQIHTWQGGVAVPSWDSGFNVKQSTTKGGRVERIGDCMSQYVMFAGGGGGGNGGYAKSTFFGIGAGAPGAGGGGGGGSGGIKDNYYKSDLTCRYGQGGIGGSGDFVNGNTGGINCRYKDDNYPGSEYGGSGGAAGQMGHRGSNGHLYYTPFIVFADSTGAGSTCIDKASASDLQDVKYADLVSKHKLITNKMSSNNVKWHSNGTNYDALYFYQGMHLNPDNLPKVDTPTQRDFSYFMGYFDQYGNQVYDKEGNLDIILANDKDNTVYKKSNFGWIVTTTKDIELTAHWNDSVTVIVEHVIADPLTLDNENSFNSNSLVIRETRRFGFKTGEIPTVTTKAFMNLDDQRIESLLTDDESRLTANERRYYLLPGEAESITMKLDQSIVKIQHNYLRNSFRLDWDYSAVCTSEEEFEKNLINADDYTKAGEVKYGMSLTYPVVKPVRGKVIGGWEPANIDSMPAYKLTMKAVPADKLFSIVNNVIQGSSTCSLTLSKSVDISYGSTINIDVNYTDESYRLVNLEAKTQSEEVPVALTQVSETKYTFDMPNDNVELSGEFTFAQYKVEKITTNLPDRMHVALMDKEEKLYTDDAEWFGITADSCYGGKLADFDVYKTKHIYILAMLEGNEKTGMEKAYRPSVSVKVNDSQRGTPAMMIDHKVNGRLRKVFEYPVYDARKMEISVQWKEQSAKRITFNEAMKSRVSAVFSDCHDNIPIETGTDSRYSSAFANDYVVFDVQTSVSGFDANNINAWYLDARGKQIPVEISTVDAVNHRYQFKMPDQDMSIYFFDKQKLPVKTELPDIYSFYVPDSAVVGATIPLLISDMSRYSIPYSIKKIQHPVALFNRDLQMAESLPFSYIDVDSLGTQTGVGGFVVPETEELVIKNGIPYRPTLYNNWFSLYCDESLTLPEYVEAFDISVDEQNRLVLNSIENKDIMGCNPILCHILEEYVPIELYKGGNSFNTDYFVFVETDPNGMVEESSDESTSNYDLHVGGTLEEVTSAKLKEMGNPNETIYRLDYDEELGQPCFVAVEADDYVFDAYSVYVRGKKGEPVIPTGISVIEVTPTHKPAYNAYGMPVEGSAKGFVIKGGYKFIVK